jgi:hypothetical protein
MVRAARLFVARASANRPGNYAVEAILKKRRIHVDPASLRSTIQ